MRPTDPAVLEIDLAAIAANWRALAARHPGGAVAGVVKADAYGLGAAQVAPALHAAGCRHFFTAHLAEALAIRPLLPGAMLGVLNGLLPGDEALCAEHGITPALGSLDEIARWTATAQAAGRRLPALLHVDTGMNRLGLDAAAIAALAADPRPLAGLELHYVMTHLVAAEIADDLHNAAQRARFAAACARLPAAPRSLANSSGIFLGPDFASDLARPGAALYGINPTPGMPNPMRPAVRLRARVLQTRMLAPGESVGYNATWGATRASRIAVVGVGYADGWLRSQSGRGHAVFDGAPAPLVGRVSMDLVTYDVTDLPRLGVGDWLDLIDHADRTPDAVAEAARTNGYEVLTSLGRRYRRVYRA
ncbi:MAG: alanine racemase [Rhodospirillales bacterium]|nr:alanine racemase [Rhodospirillales bacterium]